MADQATQPPPFADQLAETLAYAQAERLGVELTSFQGSFTVRLRQRSPRRLWKPTLEEALQAYQAYRLGKPLPTKLHWDATAISEIIEEIIAAGGRIRLEADFRKSGQGKVFHCSIGIGFSAQASGNDAAAVLAEAWSKCQKPGHNPFG